MSEEEKEAIENTKNILKEWQKIVDIKDPIERDIEMSMYSEEMPFYTMKTLLNLIDKLQKENTELKKDISNMYDKEVVISIICDNFDVTRLEVLEMLGEDE